MFKPIIGVVGPSGSGKSSSYADLPKDKTYIIDVERKGFPFRTKEWSSRIIPASTYLEATIAIANCLKKDDCEYLVIDSLSKYLDLLETAMANAFKGYDIWSNYNKKVGEFFETLRNQKATVILLAIDEILKIETAEGGFDTKRRIKVQGKRWEGRLEAEMLMVLYTHVKVTGPENRSYNFATNTDGITSAKSPAWLGLKYHVPNSLGDMMLLLKSKQEE